MSNRTEMLHFRATPEEKAAIHKLAGHAELALSEWMRRQSLNQPTTVVPHPPDYSAPSAEKDATKGLPSLPLDSAPPQPQCATCDDTGWVCAECRKPRPRCSCGLDGASEDGCRDCASMESVPHTQPAVESHHDERLKDPEFYEEYEAFIMAAGAVEESFADEAREALRPSTREEARGESYEQFMERRASELVGDNPTLASQDAATEQAEREWRGRPSA